MVNHSATLLALFTRDLNKLKEELNAYTTESHLWVVAPGISNSAGNLALHLVGNLNYFIGALLGHTGFVRDRDLEFSKKDVPRSALIEDIDKTIAMLTNVLGKLTNEDLDKEQEFMKGTQHSGAYFLTHLTAHLAYHLGQINYHRRLLDK